MACSDSGDGYNQLYYRVNMLTRFLCSVCEVVDSGRTPVIEGELKEWWEEHKKWDVERKAREAKVVAEERKRVEALSKLSEEERRLLGLANEEGWKR